MDKQFFNKPVGVAHIKGRTKFPHIRVTQEGAVATGEASAKPWRGVKKEKREKLRRKFNYLDQH